MTSTRLITGASHGIGLAMTARCLRAGERVFAVSRDPDRSDALAALAAGKHVWVENPLAATSDEARRLRDEAATRRRVLMVDHTFVYTGAVRKIGELVRAGALGDLYYYDSVRVNLGLFQSDVDVMWDLAVHYLSIMDYVLDARPRAVSALGRAHVPGRTANVAYLTCLFKDSLIADFHVNWLAPVKVPVLRRTSHTRVRCKLSH